MRKILILIFAFVSLNIFAKGTKESIPQIEVLLVSSEKDKSLNEKESQYIFEFVNLNKDVLNPIKILYSIDHVQSEFIVDSSNQLIMTTKPGVHNFQFYYNDSHFEITADSLVILPQFKNTYSVRFQSSEFPVVVDKPVIYLYPEEEVSFSLNVNPTGKLNFTYPIYNEGWNGVAHPNGDIEIDNNIYNYLFWESNQSMNLNFIDTKKGAIVKGAESIMFLEKQLDQFGFNTKEKADFTTFWGPKLQKNEFNFIHFILNDDADMFAKLNITPTPDHIYRFYILTSQIDSPNKYNDLVPQLIQPIERTGFTVFEWGGSEINLNFKQTKFL